MASFRLFHGNHLATGSRILSMSLFCLQQRDPNSFICFCTFIRKRNTLPPSFPPNLPRFAREPDAMQRPYAYRKFTAVIFHQQPSNKSQTLSRLRAQVSRDKHGTADAAPVVPGIAACLGHTQPRSILENHPLLLCAWARADDLKNPQL